MRRRKLANVATVFENLISVLKGLVSRSTSVWGVLRALHSVASKLERRAFLRGLKRKRGAVEGEMSIGLTRW